MIEPNETADVDGEHGEVPVGIRNVELAWTYVDLDDGSRLCIRPVPTKVFRIAGIVDANGYPIYRADLRIDIQLFDAVDRN